MPMRPRDEDGRSACATIGARQGSRLRVLYEIDWVRDVPTTFLRWAFMRAVFHRGYVLVSSLYFVIQAHLTASQLVLLGTAVSAALLLSDIPTGVWSDTIGRKWPLFLGHLFLAAGMVMTGVVTAF